LVVCCRSRRAPLGLEKRGRSLSQKERDGCVAGDLASRDNSPLWGAPRERGESAMSERAASAGSRRQSREIGHGKRRSIEGATSSSMEGSSGRERCVIFTDTREKRPRRSRHGRQAHTRRSVRREATEGSEALLAGSWSRRRAIDMGLRGPPRETTPTARQSESGIVKRLIVRPSALAQASRLRSKTHETRVLVVDESSGKSRFGRILRRAYSGSRKAIRDSAT
jgi:hypothetical protein